MKVLYFQILMISFSSISFLIDANIHKVCETHTITFEYRVN